MRLETEIAVWPRYCRQTGPGRPSDTCYLVMRRTGLSLLLTMMSASVVWAQQEAAAPGAIAPKLDTPQVRVIVATLQPRTVKPEVRRTVRVARAATAA